MSNLIGLGYVGLFIAALLAGSVIPFPSEVVFTGLLFSGLYDGWTLVWVALVGACLGELFNFWLGRQGKLEWAERFINISPDRMRLWETRLKKYGPLWTMFSWIPGIGNISVVLAGYFRCGLWPTALCIFLGQLARYIIWLFLNGIFL